MAASRWLDIHSRLSQIRAADQGEPRKHVVILGAGMAGLVAATELVGLGHSVEILEASRRVGGRVMTHRFSSGQYHELGAMRIPASHDYTRYYAAQLLGLRFRPFYNDRPSNRYDLRGRSSQLNNLVDATLGAFHVTDAERSAFVQDGMFAPGAKAIGTASETLSDTDIRRLFAGELTTPGLQELDSVSFKDRMARDGWSTEALTFLGTATALEGLWDRSFAMLLRDELAENSTGLEEIAGGMDRLPEGLAKHLGTDIHFGVEVERIDVQADGVVRLGLVDASGTRSTRTCQHVLCTLPFGVLRRLTISGISEPKRSAIRNMSYASSTKVILHCRERFWERQGIIGGRSYTDTIARQLYYPNDSVPASLGDDTMAAADHRGYGSIHGCSPSAAQGQQGAVIDIPATATGPGALLASYTWGADARRIGVLDSEHRAAVVSRGLRRLHPEIEHYVDGHASIFWDQHRWTMGAFAELKPRDLADYFADAVRQEGNLHFAGEHLSPLPGWIQGAAYSALEAVEEFVSGRRGRGGAQT